MSVQTNPVLCLLSHFKTFQYLDSIIFIALKEAGSFLPQTGINLLKFPPFIALLFLLLVTGSGLVQGEKFLEMF